MDGIIIINKDKGCTSHDVVYKIKKLFGTKVGHTGTLDPNATGVLPILIGKGTELSQYLINHDKKYIATVKLGQRTDTADCEGKIIEEKEVGENSLNSECVRDVLKTMIGKQTQTPPIYSAIKVKGKKLYEYARSGKSVDIPKREIEIYELNLLNIDAEKQLITFEISCSKGTYVRTVCEEIAKKLGTVGFMQDLKRTMVGDFVIENSITIEELEKNVENICGLEKGCNNIENGKIKNFITIEKFFSNKKEVILNKKQLGLFINGVMIGKNYTEEFYRVYDENRKFVGIGMCIDGKLKRKVVVTNENVKSCIIQ